jgi:hypothetical protein
MTATEPKPNLDLLRRVLKQIDEHPETWDQRAWASKGGCGTAFCVGGWASYLAGYKPKINPGWTTAWETVDDEEIEDVARRELSLSYEEAFYLFDSKNTRDDLQRIAQSIAARAGETL